MMVTRIRVVDIVPVRTTPLGVIVTLVVFVDVRIPPGLKIDHFGQDLQGKGSRKMVMMMVTIRVIQVIPVRATVPLWTKLIPGKGETPIFLHDLEKDLSKQREREREREGLQQMQQGLLIRIKPMWS